LKQKNYRIFERVRVAFLLTFISGFLDAYTFVTQGSRFAGMQTGNLIYLMKNLAEGQLAVAGSYLLPIVTFIVGCCVTYFARKFAVQHQHLRWHSLAGLIIFVGVLLTAVLAKHTPSQLTIMLLSFTAAVQLESFKRIRGVPYTNTMMTGNLKNMSILFSQGLSEKKRDELKRGAFTLLVIIGFCLGVLISTLLSLRFGENALYALLPVLLGFNVALHMEK
jgi:uncharacterized membrane protein YoaK (UPF0700 family)